MTKRKSSRKKEKVIRSASKNKYLGLKFLIDNKNNLNFHELCKVYPFTEEIANKLLDKLDWHILFIYNTTLDYNFFYNHEYYMDWEKISTYKNLPYSAIEKCPDKLNWKSICQYTKMSTEFMERNYKYLDIQTVCRYQKVSKDFFANHLIDFKKHLLEFCRYQQLSEEIMREYADVLDWITISRYQKLSESFIDEMKEYVDWSMICTYQKLSSLFIKDHKDYVNLYCLVKAKVYLPKSIRLSDEYDVCKMYVKGKLPMFSCV